MANNINRVEFNNSRIDYAHSINIKDEKGNEVTKHYATLKDFYPISDFYNFIKHRDTAPTSSRFFTIVPFYIPGMSEYYSKARSILFTNDNLYKFALSVTNIELPNFCMHTGGVDSTLDINTPIGAWRGLGNTTQFVSSNEIKFHILETQDPLIENFIYEWFTAVLSTRHGTLAAIDPNGKNIRERTNASDWDYPFPRLNIAIKYYRTDDFIGQMHPTVEKAVRAKRCDCRIYNGGN